MSHTLNMDDIWKLFQETHRLFQESRQEAERRAQEMERRTMEVERRTQEVERRAQEMERWARETEQKAKQEAERRALEAERWAQEVERRALEAKQEAKQEAERRAQEAKQEAERRAQEAKQEAERRAREAEQEAERQARAERERQEIARMMRESSAETDRTVKEVSRQIGQLGSRWGEFVEGLVAPACHTLFVERGIPVHKVSQRVRASLPGNRRMEVDLLVVNTDVVVLVEVKSKLKHEDVREHLARVAEFKEFFTEYADKRIMGAVAGIVIEENVDRFAMNEGFFVIVQSGDGVQLANDKTFVPRTW